MHMTQLGIELANLRFLDYVRTCYAYCIIYRGNYIYYFITLGNFVVTRCSVFFFICKKKCTFEQLVSGLIIKLIFMNERLEMGLLFKHFYGIF
jgi:hypothetical protein